MPLFCVSHLRVAVGQHPPRTVVDDISFQVDAGETLAIVGESGSGKSISLLTVLGLHPEQAQVSGSVQLSGREILGLPSRAMRQLRGAQFGYVSQDPLSNLHPQKTVGRQIEEAILAHQRMAKKPLRQRVLDLLNEVGIRDAEKRYHHYPHQFSGGMRQRVIIAMAIALNPAVIIADEPTTALDVTVQAAILALLKKLQQRHGCALIFISHDLGVVSEIADRVAVMQQGKVVETGTRQQIYQHPSHPYTRRLLAAAFHQLPPREPNREPKTALLQVSELARTFVSRRFWPARPDRNQVLNNISFTLNKGDIVGLVGESGSGKTTLGRIVAGLEYADEGDMQFEHFLWPKSVWAKNGKHLPALPADVRSAIQVIFQDPYTSLNPRRQIGQILRDPLRIAANLHENQTLSDDQLAAQVAQLLAQVELPPEIALRYPNQLSGGQRQRIAIARALAMRPKLIVADEAVSALDITTQYVIVQLLAKLRDQSGLSILFISHDLGIVAALCDHILVLQNGHIVEQGSRDAVFYQPRHAYTRKLLDAIPGKPFPERQPLTGYSA